MKKEPSYRYAKVTYNLLIHLQLCQNKNPPEIAPLIKYLPRFLRRKAAATRPLPIESALQTDILTILLADQ